MTSWIVTATIPTAEGGRYLDEVCAELRYNHLEDISARRLAVVLPKDAWGITYPADAKGFFNARGDAFEVRIEGCSGEQVHGWMRDVTKCIWSAAGSSRVVIDWCWTPHPPFGAPFDHGG